MYRPAQRTRYDSDTEEEDIAKALTTKKGAAQLAPVAKKGPTTQPETSITFSFPSHMGPAFRLALEAARNTLGGRTEEFHNAVEEQAVTQAVVAFGRLSAAVNAAVAGDSDKIKYLAQFFEKD